MAVRPDLINAAGLLSGAATYALVDYCMGSTLWKETTEDEGIATVSISINYVATATEGEVVCATTLDRRNRRLAVLRSEVTSDDVAAAGHRDRQLHDLPAPEGRGRGPAPRPTPTAATASSSSACTGAARSNSTISSTRATGPPGATTTQLLPARGELAGELEQHRDAARVDEVEAREVHDDAARRAGHRLGDPRRPWTARRRDVELARTRGDHDVVPLLDLEPDQRSATETSPSPLQPTLKPHPWSRPAPVTPPRYPSALASARAPGRGRPRAAPARRRGRARSISTRGPSSAPGDLERPRRPLRRARSRWSPPRRRRS